MCVCLGGEEYNKPIVQVAVMHLLFTDCVSGCRKGGRKGVGFVRWEGLRLSVCVMEGRSITKILQKCQSCTYCLQIM